MNLSFVIPAFNEADNITNVISHILTNFDKPEIIIVDDGSTDNTQDVLRKLRENIRIIKHEKRQGYTQALKTGLKYVTNDYVFCLDGDGQYKPLPIELPPKDTIINGYKINRIDPVPRIIMSKISNFIGRNVFRVKYHDMNCGYKIFHKNIIPVFNKVKYMTLSPWGEFIIRAHYEGYTIKDLGIKHYKRLHGSSKLMKNMLKVSYSNGIGGAMLFNELFGTLITGIITTQISNTFYTNTMYVVDNIYIGGYGHRKSNFAVEIDASVLPVGFSYYSLYELDKLVDELHDARERNTWAKYHSEKILVYCERGMVRSATVIAGYLMKYRRYTLNEAINLIKSKRDIAIFQHYNMRVLRDYEKWLKE